MAKNFSFQERQQYLRQAPNETYDLIIVGGGITGAGAARDAASRGMKVLLLEQTDFAQGTSSRSSKLIHGGIRYLEQLEFRLVFEALSERRQLFEMAPHLVHPLRFVLPLYKGGRVSMFKMGLGMWLYDALALFEAPEMHRRLSVEESVDQLPLLRERDLLGAFAYYDAYMDDDRLVLETLRSANEFGAQALNFVRAGEPIWENGRIIGLTATDQLTGQRFEVKGRHILSCVGPWTDKVGTTLLPNWKKRLRPSKGIHLTFRRDRLPLKDAVVMAADAEKRIIFGIPRHEMVIVGTTDTDFPFDPAEVHSTQQDVDYLLKIVNEYFPKAELKKSDIVASYAGVRPLVMDGAETESATSREHLIFSDERGVTFVAGGKYTTYRAMAEECLEEVLSQQSFEDQVRFARTDTRRPLNPRATREVFQQKEAHIEKWSNRYGLKPQTTSLLFDRHGLEAEDLIERLKRIQASSLTLKEEDALWEAEAEHAVDNTMCLGLVDFYLRRTPLFLAEPDHGFRLRERLVQVFARQYSWDNTEIKRQLDALQDHLKFEMGWRHSNL